MTCHQSVIISVVIFVTIVCCTRAAVIPPEWANVRINPCAKVVTQFLDNYQGLLLYTLHVL